MTPQLKAAIIRAAIGAGVAGLGAFLTVYLQTGNLKWALTAAIGAAVGTLGIRGAGEGLYDAARAARGQLQPGDVTRHPQH